jgi:hypothetical protein
MRLDQRERTLVSTSLSGSSEEKEKTEKES